jgi:hypothetical protein
VRLTCLASASPRAQIQEIIRVAPRQRQTMLFSATMTEEVRRLISLSLRSPVRLAADAVGRTPDELAQEVVRLKVLGPGRQAAKRGCRACPANVLPCSSPNQTDRPQAFRSLRLVARARTRRTKMRC